MSFIGFSNFSSGSHFVYCSEMILAILVGSHLGTMQSELKWPKDLGGDSIYSKLFTIFYF